MKLYIPYSLICDLFSRNLKINRYWIDRRIIIKKKIWNKNFPKSGKKNFSKEAKNCDGKKSALIRQPPDLKFYLKLASSFPRGGASHRGRGIFRHHAGLIREPPHREYHGNTVPRGARGRDHYAHRRKSFERSRIEMLQRYFPRLNRQIGR